MPATLKYEEDTILTKSLLEVEGSEILVLGHTFKTL